MQSIQYFLSYETAKSKHHAKAIYDELTRRQIPVFLVSVSFIAQFSIISQGSCFVFSMRLFHVFTPTHYRIFTCVTSSAGYFTAMCKSIGLASKIRVCK